MSTKKIRLNLEKELRQELVVLIDIIFAMYGDHWSFKEVAQQSNLCEATVRRLWGGLWVRPAFQTIQKLANGVGLTFSVTDSEGVKVSLLSE